MSSVALLVGLLVLAYIGSILVGGRAIRGYGLPSGAEYVLLGFVLGPDALGVIERSTIDVFEPIAVVGLAWLALVVGVDYGYVGARRVPARGIALGMVLTPPDVISQTLLAVPIWLLFELGVYFSGWFIKQRDDMPNNDDDPSIDRYKPMSEKEMDAELDRIENEDKS